MSRKRVIPGFGLSMGFTVLYLSLIIIIPLAALFIGGPLPHVGAHVVQAVHALARGARRGCAWPRVGVAGVRALRAVTRAPGIGFAFHPRCWGLVTHLGEPRLLPFRAGGQAAACPAAIGLGLGKIQVHSGQIGAGSNAIRLTPRPTWTAYPSAHILKTTAFFFSAGHGAGGAHIALKLADGDFCSVNRP